jgi:hypothetical protein
MDTPIFEYVLAQLDLTKGRWPTVAEESGVPYKTLVKIAQRETLDPGVNNVQKLADYFRREKAA